jgi:HAMP domain-containing protein
MSAIPRHIPTISIRYALPGVMTILITVAVLLTGLLAFRSGQDSVRILAHAISGEATTRIQDHVFEFLKTAALVDNLNLGAVQSGNLNLDNHEQLREYFFKQVKLSSAVPYAYYGAENGDFLGVDSNFGGSKPVFKIRDSKTAPDRVTYDLDDQGNPTKEIARAAYDPRTRPWYQAAVAAKGITWGQVYTSAAASLLVLSPATPVYDSTGKLKGVLSIDITLAEFTDFLRQLTISPNGKAFIIERNGDMVATSSKELPFTVNKSTGEQLRLKATDSTEPFIRSISNAIVAKYGSFDKIQQPEQFILDLNNDQQFVQVSPIKDSRGLDWLIVVAIPGSDFMESVYQNARTTAITGGIVLLVAVLLGYALASWIIRPVLTVTGVAANIEKQNYQLQPLDPVAGRSDELGHLARVVREMAQQVYQREQMLRQQVQELRIEIDEVKKAHQVAEITETEYFRDLSAKAQKLRQRGGSLP